MNAVMVDCESLGLHAESVVCTIGAVRFDPYKCHALGATFHQSISLHSSMQHGRVIDPETVLWWLKQPDAARGALVEKLENGTHLEMVLQAFTAFMGPRGETALWSCGSMDIEWLASMYLKVQKPVPWHYRTQDYRTIRDQFGTKADEPAAGTSHDALSDAIWQAKYLQNVFARLTRQAQHRVCCPEEYRVWNGPCLRCGSPAIG